MTSETRGTPPTDPTMLLPRGSDSGRRGTWTLPTVTDTDSDVDDGLLVIEAQFLGIGSSRLDRHDPHVGRYAETSERCPVCRWFETRIFKIESNDYVLHHAGRSIVPGEAQLCRHERAYSPHEVLELYTVRRPHENRTFLTRPAARALAQAAAFDDDLRDAYENRAVI